MDSNGIDDLGKFDFMNKGAYPMSQIDRSYYSSPTQVPLGAQAVQADYDPATNPLTGEPVSRFADGGITRYNGEDGSSVQTSFGYPNSAYMDPAYGYAHDPVRNAMGRSRMEGLLNEAQGGGRNENTPESENDLKVRAMVMAGNPKYDPRYMPLRLDDRPMNPIQAALLRLQAQKQMGDGEARAGISGLAAALPGQHGAKMLPGAYDVGYNMPAGPGNLDISAYRAMKGMPNGQTPYGVNARYSIPFNEGGITTIPRFDGETGSQVEEAPRDFTLGNSDLSNLSYETLVDSDRINSLNALKEADPKQYKIELMNALGESLKSQYNSNADYEPTWKQFAELKSEDPAQWNRNQLSWLGHQQGWQTGQNRSDRNEAGMPVIQDQIEQAKKAGLGEDEINKILGSSSESANVQNQNRIIRQQQAGSGPMGMNTQDYLTVAAILGSGAAAAYFAPAAAGSGGFGISAVPGASSTLGTLAAPGATGTTFGITGGALGTGVPTGLGIAQGSALVGTGAGALGAGSGTLGTTGGAYGAMGGVPGMGSTMGTGLTGGSGAAGGLGGLGGGTSAATTSSLGKVMAAKMVAESLSKAGGQDGQPSAGPSNTTSYIPFNPGQGQNNMSPYSPTSANPFGSMNMTSKGNYGFDPLVYNYGMNPRRGMAAGGIAELAAGGSTNLGSYSDGGHLLKGPGDGMSDHIPATIGGQQPARLAEGEFVIPADVVSHLGNGSTDAGAKQLYKMMDNIRRARTGNPKQGKQINPAKFTPKG